MLGESPRHIGIPAVVLYELEVGIEKSKSALKRRQQVDKLISVVNLLPFGLEEARSAAQIRAHLEKSGKSIGPYDTLIAGTALARGATLVTHNTQEFKRIRNLSLEDWY